MIQSDDELFDRCGICLNQSVNKTGQYSISQEDLAKGTRKDFFFTKRRLAFPLFFLVMQVQPFFDQIRLIFCSRDGLEPFLDVSIDPVQVSNVSVVPKAGIAIAKARDVVRRVAIVKPERGRKVALDELDRANEGVGGECRWSCG